MNHVEREVVIWGCEECSKNIGFEVDLKVETKNIKTSAKYIDEFIKTHENCGINMPDVWEYYDQKWVIFAHQKATEQYRKDIENGAPTDQAWQDCQKLRNHLLNIHKDKIKPLNEFKRLYTCGIFPYNI